MGQGGSLDLLTLIHTRATAFCAAQSRGNVNSRLIKAAEWTVAILVSATVLFVFFTRATHAGGLWRDECDSVELARLPTFSDMIHNLFQRTPVAS